jgi:diguanylate cyclase (GGDEF)-like protein
MPDVTPHAFRDLDVTGFLRPAGSRTPEFLAAKLEDHRAFTAAMMFALGPVAASLWVWDYVVDPVGAQSTIGLRLLCIAVGVIAGFVLIVARNRHVMQVAAAAGVLSACVIFSVILTRLDGGMTYGIGGYMFYPLAIILVCQGFSNEFGIAFAITAGVLPQVLALVGLMPGFPQARYAVLIWPAVVMACVALLAMSYNYGKLYDTRVQLQRVSTIDPLTGAANRRLFMPLLEKEMARARRFGHPVSLLMLDLDQFKRVNDEHGHPTGDLALVHFANTCRATIRESDTLARLGGDEFAILLPETDEVGALELAETIRATVEGAPALDDEGHVVRCTVSIGAAQAHDGDMRDTTLIARADAVLYEAKQLGGNRVLGVEPSLTPTLRSGSA